SVAIRYAMARESCRTRKGDKKASTLRMSSNPSANSPTLTMLMPTGSVARARNKRLAGPSCGFATSASSSIKKLVSSSNTTLGAALAGASALEALHCPRQFTSREDGPFGEDAADHLRERLTLIAFLSLQQVVGVELDRNCLRRHAHIIHGPCTRSTGV